MIPGQAPPPGKDAMLYWQCYNGLKGTSQWISETDVVSAAVWVAAGTVTRSGKGQGFFNSSVKIPPGRGGDSDEETRTHQNCGVAMAKHYTQQVAASAADGKIAPGLPWSSITHNKWWRPLLMVNIRQYKRYCTCFLEILKNRKIRKFSKFSKKNRNFDILKKVDGCLKIHRKSTWKSKNRFETWKNIIRTIFSEKLKNDNFSIISWFWPTILMKLLVPL